MHSKDKTKLQSINSVITIYPPNENNIEIHFDRWIEILTKEKAKELADQLNKPTENIKEIQIKNSDITIYPPDNENNIEMILEDRWLKSEIKLERKEILTKEQAKELANQLYELSK